jgi:hypothetical protein
MKRRMLVGALLGLALVSCRATSRVGNGTFAIVYGESNATTAEAVQEAMNAVRTAAQYGYRPISVGSGAGAAAAGGGEFAPTSGKLVNVCVLLEGPPGAPRILAETGIAVP